MTSATHPTTPPAPPPPQRRTRPERADITIAVLLVVMTVYSFALWPLTPALIGPHPLLLEVLSGSTVAEVTVGAHSRLHELPLWVAVVAGVPGTMMFDWVFWWAGRRWGDRALHLFLGRGTSPREEARRAARIARLEHASAQWGWALVPLAYYLPVPAFLIYVAAGLSGMRLRVFLALDLLGTLLWVGPMVGLGYAIGKPAVDVVHRIDHYSTYLTIAVVVVLVALQARRSRTAKPR